jgi:hypothetical protein
VLTPGKNLLQDILINNFIPHFRGKKEVKMKQKKFLAFVVMLLLSSFVFGERRWKEDGAR